MSDRDNLPRHSLPIPGAARTGLITYDAKDPDTKYPAIQQLRPPTDQVRMEFKYAGGGLGKGGAVTLFIDGQKVGEGQVGATAAMVFSADDGCDVGQDTGSSVSPDYGARNNRFTGRVKGVEIAIADAAENAAHLVSPEEVIRVAMARQ